MTTAPTNGTPLTHEQELALQQLQQEQPSSQLNNQQQQSAQQLSDVFTFNEYDADQNLEMRASISDVSRVYEDEAEHAGEESLRQEYEDLGAFKLLDKWSWKTVPDRLKLYFFREERKNKVKKDVMKKYETDGVDLSRTELTAAADRHERILNEWNDFQDKEDRVKILMRNIQDDRIDALCREYLNHGEGMSDKDFEDKFRAILAENPRAAKLIWKNLKHTASNILLKLRVERAYRNMMMGMLQSLETYATAQDKDAAKAAYESAIKQLVTEYVTLAQRGISPNLQKALQAPGEQIDAYRRWMRHEVALAKMQANTLKIKVDILWKGKAAYEVNNRDKEWMKFAINPLKWKPMHALNGLGKVLDKYPKTALAVSVWGTLALGIFNPAMAWFLAWVKWVAWIASKKTAHYTREQKWQEKRLVRNLEEEKKRLTHLKDVADNTWFFKKFTSGWNRYKGTRHGELYAQTTQYEFIEDTDKVIKDIQEKMIALDQEALQGSVIEALARLDYYAMSGHNFLWQKEAKNAEQTMNTLQKLVVAWAETLGVTTQDLRNEEDYKTKISHLDDMYSDVTKEFRNERRILALKYGAAAAAFSRWARSLLGSDDIHKHTWFGADEEAKNAATGWSNTAKTLIQDTTQTKTLVDPDSLKHIHDELLTQKIYGMNPEEIIKHCSNINIADSDISRKIFAEMVQSWQCKPWDNQAILDALRHMIGGEKITSEVMQDKIAYYLYHFAQRDEVLGEAIKKVPQKILEESVQNDSWSWLQAFGGGVESTVRFLGNLVASTSPIYANTFLENIEVDMTPKKNLDKTPRQANTPTGLPIPAPIALNTVVDPNLAPIPARWEDIDPAAWLIKPGDDTSWSVENKAWDVGITPAPVVIPDTNSPTSVDTAADADEDNAVVVTPDNKASAEENENVVYPDVEDEHWIDLNVANYQVGNTVSYGGEEYVIHKIESHPQAKGRLIILLKDKNGEYLKTSDGIKRWVFMDDLNFLYHVGNTVSYGGEEYVIDKIESHPQAKGRWIMLLKDKNGEYLRAADGRNRWVFMEDLNRPLEELFTQWEEVEYQGKIWKVKKVDYKIDQIDLEEKDGVNTTGFSPIHNKNIKKIPAQPAIDIDANTSEVNTTTASSSPDSTEPLSETAQWVEYFKDLFTQKTTYNVQELKKALIDKFGDTAKNIYEPLFRGYDFDDLKVQMKENGNENSPMQYNRNKRIIYIQLEKLEKFVEKWHSLETLLSALGHEIIHDIVDVNLKTQNKKKINNEATILLKMMKNQNSSNQRVNDIKKTLSDFLTTSRTRDYVYEEVLAYGLTDPEMKKYFKDNAQLKKQFEKMLTTLEDTYKLSHLKDYYNATKNK